MSAESTPASTKPVIEERVYLGNVDYKATEEDLKELFASLNVTEVDIPFKEITRGEKVLKRHLGFAFVQFASKEDADKAIEEFSGKKFHRRNVFIKKAIPPPTEDEKKERVEAFKAKKALAASKAKAKADKKEEKEAAAAAATAAAVAKKATRKTAKTTEEKVPEGKPSVDTIFVTNLDYKVDVKTLNNLFKELKPKWIHVPSRRVPYYILKKQQAEGRPKTFFNKGIAFVKFSSEEVQKKAVAEFNGKEINGREIIVDIAIDARVPKEEEAKDEQEQAKDQSSEESA
ncbi:RNA-binding domain-containing protein [Suhomyces tanzawaensis NRRL Y-17324]|uniref:RNA-binding domain-containing protein n=1 Tax=Suhomyces tanzawaensis NRRL Y-17324 TaxID=984487 RepID=A0A1E4SNE1_9ASCO|nr:RNA-binding domain-containing protein [Suhomyces tanzawaensis NRRL Y-17324]ODV81044.1 RNA-binding domain-containing protein [Suhomyces tanzawaensis NRRL Y-17324]